MDAHFLDLMDLRCYRVRQAAQSVNDLPIETMFDQLLEGAHGGGLGFFFKVFLFSILCYLDIDKATEYSVQNCDSK